jgi:hypothetical protein
VLSTRTRQLTPQASWERIDLVPTARSDERPFEALLTEQRPPSRRELLQDERREERRRIERRRGHPLRLGVTAVLALAALGAGLTWVGQTYFGGPQVIETTGQHDRGGHHAQSVEVGIRFGVAAPATADGVLVYVSDPDSSPVVRLWSSRGRLLNWGVGRPGATGWVKLPLRQPVQLTPGTSYLASATVAGSTAVAAPTAPPAAPGVTVTSVVTGWAGRLPSRAVSLTTAPVQIGLSSTATSPTVTPSTTSPSPSVTPTPTQTTKPATTRTSDSGGGATDPTGPGSATGCVAKPSSCGYPDGSNSGVPSGTDLKSVPGDVSRGSGWHYDSRGWVAVDGEGAVLDGLNIPYNVDITAGNVTVRNSRITVRGEGFGISIRHAPNVTIANNEISGPDAGSGRLMVGIKDIYADSSNLKVLRNDIWHVSTGVQIDQGLIQDNYIHDMGYVSGDHVNGTTSNGGSRPLTIQGNTILNQHDQTDAISLFQDFGTQANRTIDGNLIAGGGYTLYAGANPGAGDTANIKVTNNRFARTFYGKGGYYGPVTAYDRSDSGNVWSGNVWDDSGAAVNP